MNEKIRDEAERLRRWSEDFSGLDDVTYEYDFEQLEVKGFMFDWGKITDLELEGEPEITCTTLDRSDITPNEYFVVPEQFISALFNFLTVVENSAQTRKLSDKELATALANPTVIQAIRFALALPATPPEPEIPAKPLIDKPSVID